MPEPSLTWHEYVAAAQVGLLRFSMGESQHLNHAVTVDRTYLERLADETVGACAEMLVAKVRGSYWDASVGRFHHAADLDTWLEVRSTVRSDGCLIIRDNDPPERVYVLVTGQPPRQLVCGWVTGEEARNPAWLRDPGARRPSWFVPQAALRKGAP